MAEMSAEIGAELQMRRATGKDLPRIVEMLADDAIGATREAFGEPLPKPYWDAFAAIDADPRQLLIVAEIAGVVVGTLQLTIIPYLTHQGSSRALIEAVRVDASQRGAGVGRRMLTWAIEEAGRRGCRMVQLTTDKRRADALRFYESLGLVASHEGMKLTLGVGS
jgi:GNAT superfamily N-acetyltransferase